MITMTFGRLFDCAKTPVPPVTKARLNGNNTPRLLIKKSPIISVDSVTIDGEAQTITDWFMDGDYLVRSDYQAFIKKMYPQIIVTVTHGYATVPAAIEAAAEQFAHHWVDQATSEANLTATQNIGEYGTFNISVAGRGNRRPTGVPSVDVVLNEYKAGF